jgi:hypothetical protein
MGCLSLLSIAAALLARVSLKLYHLGEEHGAALINMGITTGVHEERTGDLYSRLGLKRSGLLYSKRFNDVYWRGNCGYWRIRSCAGGAVYSGQQQKNVQLSGCAGGS